MRYNLLRIKSQLSVMTKILDDLVCDPNLLLRRFLTNSRFLEKERGFPLVPLFSWYPMHRVEGGVCNDGNGSLQDY